jgi:uncharacterized protein
MLSRATLGLLWCVVAVPVLAALSFPELTGRVVDDAGILEPASKSALEQKLADFERKTTGQLVVVTLKSLQGSSIEDYGYQLGRHWQIGQKAKNTGALLIVAPNQRKVRIEVGYGFEGTLTDAVAKLIIENSILPRLRVNDFAGGIGRGVDDIIQAVSIDPEEWRMRAKQRPDSEPELIDLLAPLFFFVLFLILSSVAGQDGRNARTGARSRSGRGPVFLPIPGALPSGSSWPRSPGSFAGGGGSFGGGGASGSYLLNPTVGGTAPSRAVEGRTISDLDKQRILEAIRAAKEKTAAEILCVIARACGGYRLVPVAWAAIVGFATPLPLTYLTSWPAGIIYFIQLAAFIAAATVLCLPRIRFRIVPKQRMWLRVHAEATHQFLAQGVHHTRQRTGVLIFASLAEEHAVIVADCGVNAKVTFDAWAGAIATTVGAIKAGRFGDGLVAAIEMCAGELARTFPPGAPNSHELPDRVVEI